MFNEFALARDNHFVRFLIDNAEREILFNDSNSVRIKHDILKKLYETVDYDERVKLARTYNEKIEQRHIHSTLEYTEKLKALKINVNNFRSEHFFKQVEIIAVDGKCDKTQNIDDVYQFIQRIINANESIKLVTLGMNTLSFIPFMSFGRVYEYHVIDLNINMYDSFINDMFCMLPLVRETVCIVLHSVYMNVFLQKVYTYMSLYKIDISTLKHIHFMFYSRRYEEEIREYEKIMEYDSTLTCQKTLPEKYERIRSRRIKQKLFLDRETGCSTEKPIVYVYDMSISSLGRVYFTILNRLQKLNIQQHDRAYSNCIQWELENVKNIHRNRCEHLERENDFIIYNTFKNNIKLSVDRLHNVLYSPLGRDMGNEMREIVEDFYMMMLEVYTELNRYECKIIEYLDYPEYRERALKSIKKELDEKMSMLFMDKLSVQKFVGMLNNMNSMIHFSIQVNDREPKMLGYAEEKE